MYDKRKIILIEKVFIKVAEQTLDSFLIYPINSRGLKQRFIVHKSFNYFD